jgi:hypothetical protein
MSRRLTVSALFAAGLFAVAVAQPPAGAPPQPDVKKGDDKKKADPADGLVAAALANDPDVKVARAKVQLAEAELAKARQGVVLKVMTLTASIKELKRAVEAAQERAAWAERMVKQGVGDGRQLLDERAKLETAQAALARAETELKLLTGGGGQEFRTEVVPGRDADHVARAVEWLMKAQDDANTRYEAAFALAALGLSVEKHAVKGPIPDRIRAALDKPVKLGANGEAVPFEKAMEIFKKDAGFDVPVRGPGDLVKSPVIVSQGEELPVGAWLQLYQDYGSGGNSRFYVRDYGLLFTDKSSAPPDAPTVTEFWKQKPPAPKDPDATPKK